MPSTEDEYALFDAGVFIGALLAGDSRHAEARPLVEAARRGDMLAWTTGILSEVYAALTWQQAQPPHDPQQSAEAVRLLVETPSMIRVLPDSQEAALRMLELAAKHKLRARRVHDARHAAAAIVAGITSVYTYDAEDWESFEGDGLSIAGAATLTEANRLLDHYLPGHNRRFGVPPREQSGVWRRAPPAQQLDRILCLKEQRVVGRDHVVSFEGLALQVPRSRKFFSLAGRRVDVLQLRDRSIEVHHGGQAVARFSREQVKVLAKRESKAKSRLTARVQRLTFSLGR
jgi:predicted nucleic acid-binding protein